MRSEHDELIGEISTRNLSQYVRGLLPFVTDRVAYVDFDSDVELSLQDPVHAVVVLRRHRNDGQRLEALLSRPAIDFRARPAKAAHRARPAAA